MKSRLFRSRRRLLEHQAQFSRGDRVRYIGAAARGVASDATGTIVSDIATRMDVTPSATPPTVPEEQAGPMVEVEFGVVGRRQIALADLVLDES